MKPGHSEFHASERFENPHKKDQHQRKPSNETRNTFLSKYMTSWIRPYYNYFPPYCMALEETLEIIFTFDTVVPTSLINTLYFMFCEFCLLANVSIY